MKRIQKDALLLTVCLAQFMVILDISIVNVALPKIHESLGFSDTGLQWVVNAYTLTFAGFLMLAGRATDLLPRRQVFLVGVSLFSLASLGCALADSQAVLDGARAIQGFGAAVISAASLAIVTGSFKEGAERNRALGLWAAMGGVGGSAGVLLGGAPTQAFSWPAVLILNLPGRVRAWLTAIFYAIVRTASLGGGSLGVLIPLALGIVRLGLFVLVEGKLAADPL